MTFPPEYSLIVIYNKVVIKVFDNILSRYFINGVDNMDIAAASMYMHQSSLSQAVTIALEKKVLDTSNENAQSLINVLQTNLNPNLGTNIDVRV